MAAISFAIGFGCSSTTKTNEFSVSNLKDKRESDLFQMTNKGTNEQASFHPSGSKFIYVSSARDAHKTGQVYEMDFVNKRERRVSFNAGTDVYPFYHPKEDLILFSSTTDYVKENIQLEKLKATVGLADRSPQSIGVEMPPHDVYLRSPYGTMIRRLTDTSGYDGDARFSPDGKKITFSHFSDQKFSMQIFNLQAGQLEKIKLSYSDLRWPSLFYQDKQKFVAGVLETTEYSRLIVQNLKSEKPVFETSDTAIYQQPSWHPKEQKLVVSSNRLSKNNFDLFVYDFAKSCVQQVTYSNSMDQEPSFSPEGDKILFTSNRTGQNQIFMIRYDASQPCVNFAPSI